MNRSARGFIALAALVPYLVIVLAGGALYEGYKVFEPGRNKKVADKTAAAVVQTQTQAVQVDASAQAAAKAAADAVQSHKDELAAIAKNEAAAAGGSYATQAALSREVNPSANVRLALEANEVTWAAIGKQLTPSQKALWDSMLAVHAEDKDGIAARDAKIADLVTSTAAQAATIAAVTDHAKSADAALLVKETQLTASTKQLTIYAKSATTLANAQKAWADDSEKWRQRFAAAGWFSVFAVALVVVLSIKFLGAKKTLADACALYTWAKGKVVAGISHTAEEMEAKEHEWFSGDAKSETAIKAVVSQTLRQ